MMMYSRGCCRQSSRPNRPVTPVPLAPRWTREAYMAPAAPPMAPQTKGLKKRRLTPKMAGSVMPMKQEKAEGRATALVLPFLRLEGDGQGGGALCHVGGRSQGQPVGHTVHGQLAHVDDGVHMMDTGDNGGGIQTAHDQAADAERQGEQGLDAADDAVFNGRRRWVR